MPPPSATSGYAVGLSLLAFLFFLRVLGQVLVAFFGVSFLPPMPEWYSGLLPYPILLPVQVLMLTVQAKIAADFARGRGLFVVPRPALGRGLQGFSLVYFAAMGLRYVVTMAWHPERRWFGGTIPILFHWVLAAYLFVLGRYHARALIHFSVRPPIAH